jgi:hypothetical protein
MVAQQRMIEGGNLSERQSETAQKQIEKLTEIKTALVGQEQEAVMLNNDVRRITRPKRDSRSVGLVDVRDEMRNLKDNLRGLPKLIEDQNDKNKKVGMTDDEDRTAVLRRLGDVIDEKISLDREGNRDQELTARNKATFEKFVETTQQREKLLADADEKQREIFQSLEKTLLELREAGSEDSEKLRKQLDKLTGRLQETKSNEAQKNINALLENAKRTAGQGARGDRGTFGDALAALTGQREVLKAGYSREATASGTQYRGPQGMVRPEEARQGRVRGFATIVGNLAAGGYERYLSSKRSTRVENFFNSFRTTESQNRLGELQGRQEELMSRLGSGNNQGEPAAADPGVFMGRRTPADAMARDGGKKLAANVVNITAKAVTLKGPIKTPAAPTSSAMSAATNNPLFSDAGGVKSEKEDGADRIVRAIKELTEEIKGSAMGSGPGGLFASLLDLITGPGKGLALPVMPLAIAGGIAATALMGAAVSTYQAGVMNMPGGENLKKSYENPMVGAMDPDNAMGAQILQNMPADQQEYEARQKQIEEKRKNLENAPWYTRLWGIGESQYLREQQQIQGSVREVMTGQNVQSKSTINNIMREQPNQPVIITTPAPAAAAPKIESTINMARAGVRPDENGLQRYMNRTHGSYIY